MKVFDWVLDLRCIVVNDYYCYYAALVRGHVVSGQIIVDSWIMWAVAAFGRTCFMNEVRWSWWPVSPRVSKLAQKSKIRLNTSIISNKNCTCTNSGFVFKRYCSMSSCKSSWWSNSFRLQISMNFGFWDENSWLHRPQVLHLSQLSELPFYCNTANSAYFFTRCDTY